MTNKVYTQDFFWVFFLENNIYSESISENNLKERIISSNVSTNLPVTKNIFTYLKCHGIFEHVM